MRYTLSRSLVIERSWPVFLDLTVAVGLLAGFYAVLISTFFVFARKWLKQGPDLTLLPPRSPLGGK